MIITSFMRVVYPLKYPSNACLSCLDKAPCCLNAIIFRVSKCHRCLTIIKHSNIKALLTYHCMISKSSYLDLENFLSDDVTL